MGEKRLFRFEEKMCTLEMLSGLLLLCLWSAALAAKAWAVPTGHIGDLFLCKALKNSLRIEPQTK